eukprot:CAMPEP_0198202432 /NCGR_PEP_ID=MMETSP1445-20131203/5610_1 /TAXON_ID=36898 /ORGANISM="Pyramimonas sp., Strain CCMP2087" /LENGTH=266 /DNA_ID=CAMNT_0043873359 /DNA_START=151 /DNA_END=951 /DNA_ORIENTATION=-
MMFSSKACRSVLFLLSLSLGGASVSDAKRPKVELLSAGNYVILTKSGISTVPTSAITGNIAVSPIAGEAMTGFSTTLDAGGQFSTSSQLTGQAFAANYAIPTPASLTTAVSAMEAAYTNAAGRLNSDAARTNMNSGTLGGNFGGAAAPLTPGVYTFGSGVHIADTIYFQGTGPGQGQGDTDVFIIQSTGVLSQAANTRVELTGGALAKNIFWQIAGNVAVGAGAHLKGILLVKTDVLFTTGSSLNGRVLAQTACNLQMATITEPSE